MGRWSQRRHAGGAGKIATPTIVMVEALSNGDDQLLITYSAPIDANDFLPSDFNTDDFVTGDEVSQAADNILEVVMADTISLSTSLTYADSVAGVLSPQTITITQP